MPKQKITISLDSEIAKALRLQSIEKYGDSRSMSRLIEDLATGAAEAKLPEAKLAAIQLAGDLEGAINPHTECPYIDRSGFERSVNTTFELINELEVTDPMFGDSVTRFFVLKAAYEQAQNKIANQVNKCYKCCFLNGPLPTYPEYDNFAIMCKLRNRVLKTP